ncbi:carbohydrate ABC transporter permease [Pseudalkalibacillus hwajinpoensis]|uniref:carbohydrate ABC transporter permease n=1 Tax=Guptibacillus hwajinpoensis TaxID=208199 RepID=UPI001CD245D8|nr:sugar ABC transporter permease [Pseudalkalibacillus hwajinpoensis]MCA0991269.1 sugar ABC transporter permease [Pseudalkalibacillus hwajinpoensis]
MSREKLTKLKNWYAKESTMGWVFILPLLLYFIVFQLAPMLLSFGISFTSWNLRSPAEFVGFENYKNLLFDSVNYPDFWPSLWITLKYIVFSLPGGIFIALVLAAMLNANVKGEGFFKTAYYIPNITAMVAVAAMWIFLLDPKYGLVSQLFDIDQSWLGSKSTALPTLGIMAIWSALGYNVLILLTTMKGIPDELYESATIDGANAWQKFTKVTLPMIQPTIFFLIVTGLIAAFQVFDQMYLMTGGGPDGATQTYMLSLYNHAFRYFEMGTASAMSYILLIIILIITWVNFKFIPQRFDD